MDMLEERLLGVITALEQSIGRLKEELQASKEQLGQIRASNAATPQEGPEKTQQPPPKQSPEEEKISSLGSKLYEYETKLNQFRASVSGNILGAPHNESTTEMLERMRMKIQAGELLEGVFEEVNREAAAFDKLEKEVNEVLGQTRQKLAEASLAEMKAKLGIK